MDDDAAVAVILIVGFLLLAVFYALPTFIAFKRQHEYRWIIFAINMFFGPTGLGWLIALIWACYPKEKSFADPVLGNPTGLGSRNSGDTLGEVRASSDRSYERRPSAQSALDAIDRLAALAEKGVITAEEFAEKKANLLSHV